MDAKTCLKDRLKSLGRNLPEYQIEKIVSYIGKDEALLVKAADKIDILLDIDEKINIKDIEELFVKKSFDSYMKLIKHIGSSNLKACLEEFNSIKDTGYILGFTAYYFKWLDRAFVFLIKKSKNTDDHIIRDTMGISHFEYANLEKYINGYSTKRIVKILNGLCELDICIKEKGIVSKEIIHNFLIEACVGC